MNDLEKEGLFELARTLDRSMNAVPGGVFRYGLTQEEKNALAAEEGVHPEYLHFFSSFAEAATEPFWMDTYPVTRAQFLRFMMETGYKISIDGWLAGWTEYLDIQKLDDPERWTWPVVGINVEAAEAYAVWAGKRLPTEVEREKAARQDGDLSEWNGLSLNGTGTKIWPMDHLFPVGSRPRNFSVHGCMDMQRGVLEWARISDERFSLNGKRRYTEKYILTGSSIRHRRRISHLPSTRWNWHDTMKLWDTGFRCVSDRPPEVPSQPYRPPVAPRSREICVAREAYESREAIVLSPMGHATVKVEVPWFPGGCWIIDIPESRWGAFPCAVDWPGDEAKWRVNWQRRDGELGYHFENETSSLDVSFRVDFDQVHAEITPRGIGRISLNSICTKALNPFFCDQESLCFHRIRDHRLEPVAMLPRSPELAQSFYWTDSQGRSSGMSLMRSLDGAGYFAVVGPAGCGGNGNGAYPCTHLHYQFAEEKIRITWIFALCQEEEIISRVKNLLPENADTPAFVVSGPDGWM